MIRFSCSECGKSVKTPASAVGKQGRCPFCKTIQAIPHPSELAFTSASLSEQEVKPATADPDAPPAARVATPATNVVATPAKKMYREYTANDAGKKRSVSINLGGK